MNPTLKTELDKLCTELAAKHSTTEKFINLLIQVNLITTKLGIIATFAKSTHINVKESVNMLSTEMSNISLIGASLAGFREDDTAKIMEIYQSVHARMQPLLTAYYQPAASKQSS